MNIALKNLPYRIGASSMVFGHDTTENASILADIVDHMEIVLFHTPNLHNIPDRREIRRLNEIRRQEGITYSVHLPASLEIASPREQKRNEHLRMIREIVARMEELEPVYYILHIPFSPPTLAAVPGQYFKSGNGTKWEDWTARALESLSCLRDTAPELSNLLLENINYSPHLLKPFLKEGCRRLCLDIGHMLLGAEPVVEILEDSLDETRELHLHGVKGHEEHLSASVLPEALLIDIFRCLHRKRFDGVLNLEVFAPDDLHRSLAAISKAIKRVGHPVT